MLCVVEDGKNGIYIHSNKTQNNYELLEMMSYHGMASSDIVVIMIATEDEGYVGLLDFSFGANDKESIINWAKKTIEAYENGTKEPLDLC